MSRPHQTKNLFHHLSELLQNTPHQQQNHFKPTTFSLFPHQNIMKFSFPFKSTQITITTTTSAAAASSWPWPTCATTPRTLSFRASADNIYKTISPVYLDDDDEEEEVIATATPHESYSLNPESAVISGLKSERLFFEPGATSSILEGAKSDDDRGSVAMVVMDSMNPFLDFRVSMEEMAEAYCDEVRDWEFMENLLEWYLIVNDESIHGYIVAAFVDLLISAIDGNSSSSDSASASTKYSFTSPLSFSSSSTSTEDHKSFPTN